MGHLDVLPKYTRMKTGDILGFERVGENIMQVTFNREVLVRVTCEPEGLMVFFPDGEWCNYRQFKDYLDSVIDARLGKRANA